MLRYDSVVAFTIKDQIVQNLKEENKFSEKYKVHYFNYTRCVTITSHIIDLSSEYVGHYKRTKKKRMAVIIRIDGNIGRCFASFSEKRTERRTGGSEVIE